ncbi:23S rRNA (guanosine(2251)-2'-O)-methyltransferas e RlmB [Desulfonema ishimotonii]|uniref:23S rRNA (Guanosine(2251)-2'-O)-methyltransferas e RlmB n=1 Tax=Desulfonema ishimotonii TaxID=45657 RepID=A0A401G3L8_9BACT|nr:23S rRNA (guanosine(2251)-2'-O)-methyltransferase RlmB [Desulfonema ishimotonii]GBC63837.1 23S rRNA (guanosine(2251)-2'-O)-methyltransferas e RlmB [Desulfonema ishimotonii]
MKTEILFGVHPVAEALRAGRREISEILMAGGRSSPRSEAIANQAAALKIPVRTVSSKKLTALTGSDFHQGIAACVSPYPYVGIGDILRPAEPFLLILDSVVDTHNLGALIRTALCAGINGVIIPKDRAASPSPAVSKASAGALEHMAIVRETNLVNVIRELKAARIWIAGLDMAGDQTLYKGNLTGPLALVVGGEEKGIRPLVRKQCDFLLSIPQEGPLNSLNASVAGAVVMYEAYRQRCHSA